MPTPTAINLNDTVPAAPTGLSNLKWQADMMTTRNVSAYMVPMVGDTGSGGTSGAVPSPGAGTGAAHDFLRADATWATAPAVTNGVPPFNAMMTPASITPPVISALTLGNAGATGALAFNAGGAVYMSKTGTNANDLFHAYKTAPATPWTFTIGFVPGLDPNTSTMPSGILMRQSSTAKLVFFNYGQVGSNSLFRVGHWTNYTTLSAQAISNTALVYPGVIYFQVVNSGTTFTFNYAIDGQNFRKIFSESVTAFFSATPDQIGIGLDDFDATVCDAIFVHWAGI